MRLVAFIIISIAFTSYVFADTMYVPDDYPTIQGAIDASKDGDTVIVKPGNYVENIDFKGKAITLVSEQRATLTVIDGNQAESVVTFKSNEGPDSVLDGFTITNGSSAIAGGINCYLNSGPTIANNIITGNCAVGGSGIHCYDSSSPIITNNAISENTGGGTIWCYDYSDPTIMNNLIFGNVGSGITCTENSSPTIMNNIISFNSAKAGGGGINCEYYSFPTITNNTIAFNTAKTGGGGIYCWCYCSLNIKNTILWGNQAPSGSEIWIGDSSFPSTLTINYSDTKGGKNCVFIDPNCTLNWGSGMIDADPLFVDSADGDFHLTFPSPCKGTGDNTAVTELYDFEGDPRIAYGAVDMGADEFYTHLYWTGDATPGGNVELKFVGLPGTSPVLLWLGSGLLDPPWPTKYGDWYLQFPLLVTLSNLGPIPSPDGVLLFPFTFPANTPTPLMLPFQAGIGMELSNLSVMEVE